jgi:RHS repeat-associated protein
MHFMSRFRLLIKTLCLSSLLLAAPCIHATNIPCEKRPDAERCKCDADFAEKNKCGVCKQGGGTGAGSITFTVPIAGFATGESYEGASLSFSHDTPSITMFSPQGLNYLGSLGSRISKIEGNLDAAETVYYSIVLDQGGVVRFSVADGASVGVAEEVSYQTSYSLDLLDAQMQPTATAPVFVRLNRLFEGMAYLFDATTGDIAQAVDEKGKVRDYTGAKVIRQDGVLRQIKSPFGLTDIVTVAADLEYVIRLYSESDVGALNSTTGLYALASGATPYQIYTIKNPSGSTEDIDEIHFTRECDGRFTQWRFAYTPANQKWTMIQGELVATAFTPLRQETTEDITDTAAGIRTHVKKVLSGTGTLLAETVEVYNVSTSEKNAKLSSTVDPTGANLVTNYTYYTSGTNAGERLSEHKPDGSWTAYAYDAKNRETLRVEPWKDLAWSSPANLATFAATAKSVTTSYTPVDSLDNGTLAVDSPREETVKVLGQVTGRTWHAYHRNAGHEYVEITERASSTTASYGATANLRTTRVYYASTQNGESPLRAGNLKSEQEEDGTLTTYDYGTDAEGRFVVTTTHTHADAPAGVANRSLQRKRTHDTQANLVREDVFLYTGSSYIALYHDTHGYDHLRNRVESRRHDGVSGGRVIAEATYEHGKAITQIDSAGIVTEFTYDILDRLLTKTKVGDTATGVGDITEFSDYSTSATGCGCSAAELRMLDATGTLSLVSVRRTDRAERETESITPEGLTTTKAYAQGGRIVTTTLPSAATHVVENYLDGRRKSLTGTAVIAEYSDYGVNTDGTLWEKTTRVAADGVRWTRSVFNPLGQLTRVETPAHDGGVLATVYGYDARGRQVSETRRHIASGGAVTVPVAPQLTVYDAAGEAYRTGLDVNGNGQLDLASADRITDQVTAYVQPDGTSWWRVTQTTIYPETNNSTALTVTKTRQRLTGYSGSLADEQVTLDLHDNPTTRRTETNRTTRETMITVTRPDAALPSVTVVRNGLRLSQTTATTATPTVYNYDGLGRLVSERAPRHTQAAITAYHATTGQVGSITDASGQPTTFLYVPQGQPGAGQQAVVTNALGHTLRYAYDAQGRITHVWGTADYPQAYAYTPHGELSTLTTWRQTGSIDFNSVTWPAPTGGDTTTWVFQASTGLLTRKQYADGQGTGYTYDTAHRLAVRTWAREVTPGTPLATTYGYATTGELVSIDYADTTPDVALTYTRFGAQQTLTDGTGTRTYTHTPTLGLDQEQLPAFYGSRVLARTYQVAASTSEPTSVPGRANGFSLGTSGDLDSDYAVTYGYDTSGRLGTVTDPNATFTYGYLANSGQLRSTITGPVHTATTTYEPERDVITRVENKVGATTVSKFDYTVNNLGQRTRVDHAGTQFMTGSNSRYTYDSLGQVQIAERNNLAAGPNSERQTYTFNYDSIGNRVSRQRATEANINGTLYPGGDTVTYTPNTLNQYASYTGAALYTPIYDADGNQTFEPEKNVSYRWDAENRLVEAVPVVPGPGAIKVSLQYDAQSRLVGKTRYYYNNFTASWGVLEEQRYLYDGWNVVAMYQISGTALALQRTHTWGLDLSGSLQEAGGVGGLLSVREYVSRAGVYQFSYDANGNVSEVIRADGVIAAHYEYGAFGETVLERGSYRQQNPFKFSTKPAYDGLQGLYYYGFRYYNPSTGRWPNRDPVDEQGGLNIYAFVGNSPLTEVDVLGLKSADCCGGKKFYASRGAACCGNASKGEVYNPATQGCCDGKKFKMPNANSAEAECCENGQVQKSVAEWKYQGFSTKDKCIAACVAGNVAQSAVVGAGAALGDHMAKGRGASGAGSAMGRSVAGSLRAGARTGVGAAAAGLALSAWCANQCSGMRCNPQY